MLFWWGIMLLAILISSFYNGFITPKILLISFRKRLFDEPDKRKIHHDPQWDSEPLTDSEHMTYLHPSRVRARRVSHPDYISLPGRTQAFYCLYGELSSGR